MQVTSSVVSPSQPIPAGSFDPKIKFTINTINKIAIAISMAKKIEETLPVSKDFGPIYDWVSLARNLVEKNFAEVQTFYTNLNQPNEEIDCKLKQVGTVMKIYSAASSVLNQTGSLLDGLASALKCSQEHKSYAGQYLIRNLFIQLVLFQKASSPEEIRKAIELEQEHLDSLFFFLDQPGTEQQKYNLHLSNCLNLLARHTGLTCKSRTLKEAFPEVLQHAANCLTNKSLLPEDAILIRKTLAFFFLETGVVLLSRFF